MTWPGVCTNSLLAFPPFPLYINGKKKVLYPKQAILPWPHKSITIEMNHMVGCISQPNFRFPGNIIGVFFEFGKITASIRNNHFFVSS